MFSRIAFVLIALGLAVPAAATDGTDTPVTQWKATPDMVFQAADVVLEDFKWIARPVVVFADSPADPAFQRQMELIENRADEMTEREVVLIIDTDPAAESDLRKQLRPRGFMLTVIGKDGGVKLRKPFPWDVRELTRSIDKMPIRKQEIRDRQAERAEEEAELRENSDTTN